MHVNTTPVGTPAPTSTPVLELLGLSKSFKSNKVLNDVSLTIASGDVHALLGQNGSGKSTLIKLLSAYHVPDELGALRICGEPTSATTPEQVYGLGCRFVHQDLALFETGSVLENILISAGYPARFGMIRRREARAIASSALAMLGLSLDLAAPLSSLTASQKTGVAIARALVPDRDNPVRLLVLDEPTAAFEQNEVERLQAMLRQVSEQGVGVLYVTHYLDEVFGFADRVSVLRDGKLVSSVATADTDRKAVVRDLVGRELAEVTPYSAQLTKTAGASAERLRVSGLSSARVIDFSISLTAGEIVGVYGLDGSGRESVLGLIFGALPRRSGDIAVDGTSTSASQPAESIRRGVAYVPPDRRAGAFANHSARENITLTNLRPFRRASIVRRGRERTYVRKWFQALDVRPTDGIDAPLKTFSGGNQQKVVLAKWLQLSPAVLLLDGPTVGVDVGAKRKIHERIVGAARDDVAVLISSTDVEELAAICSRVLIMQRGRVVDELFGQEIEEQEIGTRFHSATVSDQEVVTG